LTSCLAAPKGTTARQNDLHCVVRLVQCVVEGTNQNSGIVCAVCLG
jgi:hypothetical protein